MLFMKADSRLYLLSFIELLFIPLFGIVSLVFCGWLKQSEINPHFSIPFFRDREQLRRWISIILWAGLVVFLFVFISVSIVLLKKG